MRAFLIALNNMWLIIIMQGWFYSINYDELIWLLKGEENVLVWGGRGLMAFYCNLDLN